MSDETRPGPALGYSEDDDGIVTLRMTRNDFSNLLIALGMVAAKPDWTRFALRLANRINLGRPPEAWKPYLLPHEESAPNEADAPPVSVKD